MLTALDQTGDRDAALARFAQSVTGAEAEVLREALTRIEAEGDIGNGLWGNWPTRHCSPRSPWEACGVQARCCVPPGRAGPRRPRFCCGRGPAPRAAPPPPWGCLPSEVSPDD